MLKPEQLDALVSPVALYPDTLLAEVLMASTYPLEVESASGLCPTCLRLSDTSRATLKTPPANPLPAPSGPAPAG